MPDGLVAWWDTLELWLAQQWFPVQFVLVMVVLVPLCVGAAWLLDKVVDHAAALLRSGRRGKKPGDRP